MSAFSTFGSLEGSLRPQVYASSCSSIWKITQQIKNIFTNKMQLQLLLLLMF